MFDNIGGKIKTVAKVVCWLGIALFIVLGLILLIAISTYSPVLGFAVAIPVILLGAVLSWIGSFTLYGYGELIELTAKIERNTKHF
ncbi:MAG TPA: hypothetical protein DDW30_01750 [Clostridiales bacterium]|nr:hypothetical protein [Clostridiales bacterium]